MPRTLMSAALAAGLGVMPLAAQAASVTLDFEAAQFDTLILAGSPILEDGFEIATISGNVFGIAVFGGVQGQSLFVGYRNAPSIGDTLEITRADGGLFNVTEFDFASNAGDLSDAVDIVGLRGTTKTGELLGVSSNSSFATQSGSVFGTIDTLRFVVSGVGAASLRLDNFDVELAPIPLPAGGWLMLAGLGALGAVGRRRSLKASRLGLLSKKGPTPMKTCALIAA
ncbi:MAG: VPLPA-CTERM sorting domain-containing protein, partial [Pseudomonadota bacterium]